MKIYKVGGCVRDFLLGLPPKDIDYVVVGSTPEEMLHRGFEKVGAAFPVFLKNGEEYALARKERKVGAGYHGFEVVFDPSVTLEEDLYRRDLTINSMAMDIDTNEIIDPYNGRQDLTRGILRHTSEAFAEDPVRVLRTARFAARYGFDIDFDTLMLMRVIVSELDLVSTERIWAELQKGLMERFPYIMMKALYNCGAFCNATCLKSFADFSSLMYIVHGKTIGSDDIVPLYVRLAMVTSLFTKSDFVDKRIPTELATVAFNFHQHKDKLSKYLMLDTHYKLHLLNDLRALHTTELLDSVLDVLKTIRHDNLSADYVDQVIRRQIHTDIAALKQLDCKTLVEGVPSARIPLVIHTARAEILDNLPK